MFEQDNKGRKYVCFVCGVAQPDYETYKTHIKENHDLGREYLSCPVCDAPVRSMPDHFKAKHPSRQMPSGLQLRVGVWHDFKSRGGKTEKKTRKPTFRQGVFSSKKCGKDIPYRSGLECDFFEALEADTDVLGFTYEGLKVPYYYQNSWKDYIPDLKVVYVDGKVEIWEIKPTNQTHYEQNQAKWAAANNFFGNLGYEFIVQTENALGKLKQKVKRQHMLRESGEL